MLAGIKSAGTATYTHLVHAAGLRLAGHTFFVLPACRRVIVNGYTGRADRFAKRHYLFSSKIARENYRQVGIEDIENLDVVASFNLFETRRRLMEDDLLDPIEPFRS
jgi:hypothetical protein